MQNRRFLRLFVLIFLSYLRNERGETEGKSRKRGSERIKIR